MIADFDPWDRGAGEPRRSPPGPRRIAPSDLPSLTTSAPPTSPPSRSPSSPSAAGASAGDPACPSCRGAGWLVADAKYDSPTFGQLRRCACMDGVQIAARQARAAEYLARVAGDLGPELAACTLDGIDRQRPLDELVWWDARRVWGIDRPMVTHSVTAQRLSLGRACAIARSYQPESLYLWGPNGSGKSHIAAAILNAQAAQGVAGCYRSAPAMLRMLRQGFEDRSSDHRLEALIRIPLLVLDDLGAESRNDWNDQTLFDLINERANARRATIVTCNLPPELYHDPRLASRWDGSYTQIALITSDYRLIQAERRSA